MPVMQRTVPVNVSMFIVYNPGQFRLLESFMKRSEHYPDDQISYGIESLWCFTSRFLHLWLVFGMRVCVLMIWWLSRAGFCCYWTNSVRDESNGTELTFWQYSLAFLSVFLCPRGDSGKKRTFCGWKSCILEWVFCVLKSWTAPCAQLKIMQWQSTQCGRWCGCILP
jgi:hypothetical protein